MSDHRGRGRGLRFWLSVAAIFIVLCGLGSAVFANQVYQSNIRPVSDSENFQLFTVPLGATAKEIGDELEDKGLIRKSWAFQWYVRNSNVRGKLQAGTYAIRQNQSVKEIVDLLSKGVVATDWVTILPAKRLDEIKVALINSGFTPADVEAALKPAQYASHPALVDKPADANLEGYLYPETFQKSANTNAGAIVKASLDQMQRYLTPALRADIVQQGLTVHQGVILASVVENEVSDKTPEDKAKVAQVFLRRLRIGMRLQSDATTKYGAVLDGATYHQDYPSAYNTYQNAGLPPTPISNVSKTSLEAVANPASTDYLFFLSGDDGTTHFARTEAEHNANKANFCRQRCTR